MPITTPALESFPRHEPGWGKAGELFTGHNADNAILVGGAAIKLAADQTGADVFPRVQAVNASTDVVEGFVIRPKVQHRYVSLESTNSIHNTFDIATQRWGYARETAVAYTKGTEIYVTADQAIAAGADVHVVAATPTRIRGAATAGVTTPATGWKTRQNAVAGQTVRIIKA